MLIVNQLIGFAVSAVTLADQTTGITPTYSDNGGTASALVDDNPSNPWFSGANDTGTITFDLGSSKTLSSYSLTADSGNFDRCPITWTLKYSATGSFSGEEVTADSQTSVAVWSASEKRTYNFSEASARYWQFSYLAKTDALGRSNEYYIAEMELIGF